MQDIMGTMDIAFPHLGIYLKNVPKSFSIFGFEIALYGVIIGIGVLCGVFLASYIAKKENMDADVIWDFAIYAIIFSIIGARIYYVVFSWDL
jgi:phosphatidylglycerol:prolipoprotein diacylglycerol transferase